MKLTLKTVRATLRAHGVTIRSAFGEYRIYRVGSPSEDYFTSDLGDALHTGLQITGMTAAAASDVAQGIVDHLRFNAIQTKLDKLRYGTEYGCDTHATQICELEIELASIVDRIAAKDNN